MVGMVVAYHVDFTLKGFIGEDASVDRDARDHDDFFCSCFFFHFLHRLKVVGRLGKGGGWGVEITKRMGRR